MKIVISGVNLVEGGPLKVFYDAIKAFANSSQFDIVCLVHKKALFSDFNDSKITFIEFPEIKKSWFKRFWFEYRQCLEISRSLKPDIWLSMHDMSPNVDVKNQFVYCHNPSPFYKASIVELKFEPKLFLFTLLYECLYKINIRSNRAVIAQQEWIGQYLVSKLGAKEYIVSKPLAPSAKIAKIKTLFSDQDKITFFFPALARTFKNFELILNALKYLKYNDFDVYKRIEVNFTINADSNKYASNLINAFSELDNVNYLGYLSFKDVIREYKCCDVVLFPSKLETWGLPISEAKEFCKPIILSDLPYAHETLGCYGAACFVDVDDHLMLAKRLKQVVQGDCIFEPATYKDSDKVVSSWEALVNRIYSMT